MMSDEETMSDFPHPFMIGAPPAQAAQAAANDFLSCSTERAEAISALVRLPPDVMASILLANIPFDFSMDRQETRKIFEALDYVKAGIHYRAKHWGVYFCNGKVKLPEETFTHVLEFLDKRDLIDNVSHVSYAWAKACLSPNVRRWQKITFYDTYNPTRELLLQMLKRPQFARLKKLVLSFRLTDNLIKEIAEACPTLEKLTVVKFGKYFSSETLCKLPTLFPKLNRIRFALETSSRRHDVIALVKTMGIRLVEVKVTNHVNLRNGFKIDDFINIGRYCPNLRSFKYWSELSWTADHSIMTERCLSALVEGCPKLEKLFLCASFPPVSLEAFRYIAQHAKNLRFLYFFGNFGGTRKDYSEAIRKCFANRLESIANYKIFEYRLLPVPL